MALTRSDLARLLAIPDDAPPVTVKAGAFEDRDGYRIETKHLDRGTGTIPATCLRPVGRGPHPAILYCHAHGNAWEIGRSELLLGRPALADGAYGPHFARNGFVVLCLDMPGNGERQAEGPETALSKAALWSGRTLMGEMLLDLQAGLGALAADDGVDAARLGALGFSMGATHAYWLAALDQRVSAVAHLCAFSDMKHLIALGAHDLHGPYMTVPGLLRAGDMGDVASLIAPRPQLVCAGTEDPLTPPEALDPALETLRNAYANAGASDALTVVRADGEGHRETPEMRRAVVDFFHGALGSGK